jgi:hypothetical protein
MGGASSWNQPTLSSTERINQSLVQKEPPREMQEACGHSREVENRDRQTDKP